MNQHITHVVNMCSTPQYANKTQMT